MSNEEIARLRDDQAKLSQSLVSAQSQADSWAATVEQVRGALTYVEMRLKEATEAHTRGEKSDLGTAEGATPEAATESPQTPTGDARGDLCVEAAPERCACGDPGC